MKHGIKIVSFTERGAQLSRRIFSEIEHAVAYGNSKYLKAGILPLEEPVSDWAVRWFDTSEALIFIGAVGIAVRAIGPLARSKATDPAVVCVDEAGRFVIPLLSGHIGGANRLAEEIAAVTGGTAVITTATDINGVFAPDIWALEQGCAIPFTGQIKELSAALLAGELVGITSEFPLDGKLPDGLVESQDTRCGIYLGLRQVQPYRQTLWLVPGCLRLGVGCRRGIGDDVLETFVLSALEAHDLPLSAVRSVGSIDLKVEEPALLAFCNKYQIPLDVSTAGELSEIEGSKSGSDFVQMVTGVDNVCERAALKQGGELLVDKTAANGVTLAVVKQEWRVNF